jgi:hypothetical protein
MLSWFRALVDKSITEVVATSANNDREIGQKLAGAMRKVGANGVILRRVAGGVSSGHARCYPDSDPGPVDGRPRPALI